MKKKCRTCGKLAELNSKNECKECCKKRNREYYLKHRESRIKASQENYQQNKKERLEYAAQYRKDNKDSISKKYAQYMHKRRKSDPLFKLTTTCRTRIFQALQRRSYKKTKCSLELVGCSWLELQQHLESQFTEGMSWDNYGEWHVDHIIPLCSAATEEEMLELFHYTNLQPLWAADNLKKQGKLF